MVNNFDNNVSNVAQCHSLPEYVNSCINDDNIASSSERYPTLLHIFWRLTQRSGIV